MLVYHWFAIYVYVRFCDHHQLKVMCQTVVEDVKLRSFSSAHVYFQYPDCFRHMTKKFVLVALGCLLARITFAFSLLYTGHPGLVTA
jgi:hypothetical protein